MTAQPQLQTKTHAAEPQTAAAQPRPSGLRRVPTQRATHLTQKPFNKMTEADFERLGTSALETLEMDVLAKSTSVVNKVMALCGAGLLIGLLSVFMPPPFNFFTFLFAFAPVAGSAAYYASSAPPRKKQDAFRAYLAKRKQSEANQQAQEKDTLTRTLETRLQTLLTNALDDARAQTEAAESVAAPALLRDLAKHGGEDSAKTLSEALEILGELEKLKTPAPQP